MTWVMNILMMSSPSWPPYRARSGSWSSSGASSGRSVSGTYGRFAMIRSYLLSTLENRFDVKKVTFFIPSSSVFSLARLRASSEMSAQVTSTGMPSSAARVMPMTPEPHPMSRILSLVLCVGGSVSMGVRGAGGPMKGGWDSFLLASSMAISTSSSVSGLGMSARLSVLNSRRKNSTVPSKCCMGVPSPRSFSFSLSGVR